MVWQTFQHTNNPLDICPDKVFRVGEVDFDHPLDYNLDFFYLLLVKAKETKKRHLKLQQK
jgi:hypothetical protein